MFTPAQVAYYTKPSTTLSATLDTVTLDLGVIAVQLPVERVARWTGSVWSYGALKRWTGSSWATGKLKRWSGTAWVPSYASTSGQWTPASLATLSSWYDPSETSTVTTTSSQITNITNKQGTTARNLVQGTSTKGPTHTANAIGSRHAMVFDGTDDYLEHSSPHLYTSGGATVAAMFKAAAQNDKHTIGENKLLGPASPIYSILRTQYTNTNGSPDSYIQSDGSVAAYSGTPTYTAGTQTLFDNTARLWTGVDTGSNITHYVDGNQSSSQAYTRNTPMTLDRFTVGCLQIGGNQQTFFVGTIGEIVACTGALSTDDRQKLEGYLAHKWGTTAGLPAGHPYKSTPP